MELHKIFASSVGLLLPLSLALGTSMLLSGGAGCGSKVACFQWTEAEGVCPAQDQALTFFQSPSCSSEVISVDSEPSFDDGACCYAVTEENDPFDIGCSTEPTPFPPDSSGFTAVAVGVGGAGGVSTSGVGGAGGAGGSEPCAKCGQFLLETNPPPLCAGSVQLYEKLTDCRCYGACAASCGETCDTGSAPSSECEKCLTDKNAGCGTQYLACSQDK
jgi:hypothetical protein